MRRLRGWRKDGWKTSRWKGRRDIGDGGVGWNGLLGVEMGRLESESQGEEVGYIRMLEEGFGKAR